LWVDSRFNGANLLVVSSELWSSAVSDSSLILLYWLSVPVKPWFCKKKCLSQRVCVLQDCARLTVKFSPCKKMSKGIVKKIALISTANVDKD
jgi:hypothetical protein